MDGKGDGWAEAHREHLGNDYYFQDVDCLFGGMVYGANTAERLFLEYAPDDYRNRENRIRNFAIISMFDRKRTLSAATHPRNTISLGVYLHLCRVIEKCQPVAPKFFFVIGDDSPPWAMYEVDINDGTIAETATILEATDWKQVWNVLGLRALRDRLSKWIA